ncbi:MAG: hypothetical protein AAGI38_15340 [Bacteroidota bacterium]
MKGKLEKHIETHKSELDIYEPSPHIWQGIDQELRPVRPLYQRISRIAAVIALLAGTTFGVYHVQQALSMSSDSPVATASHEQHYPQELREIEAFYTSEIENRRAMLTDYRQSGIELDDSFDADLERLKVLYGELQQELVEGEDKEQIVKAMISNLRMQMEVLQQQLSILKQIQSMKSQHEQAI